MLRFVHTADIHFDTPFSARFSRKQAELRRKEVMQTFRKITKVAGDADLFLIAGDLFDGEYVSGETIAFLKRMFAEIPQTQVFIAAGNHDAFTASSVYAKESFGENVHIFSTEQEYLDIPELSVRVHGRSFARSYEESSLLNPLSLSEEFANILVMHGEITSSGEMSNYNPVSKERIANCGADYVALGHIHGYAEHTKPGESHYAYPGIPEGRGFDELGEKGYISGVISDGIVKTEFIPCCCRRFHILTIDVTGLSDGLEIAEKIKETVQKEGAAEDIYRFILTGETEPALIQADFLDEQIKEELFFAEWEDCTAPQRNEALYLQDAGLKGDFVREMIRRRTEAPEEERAEYELALRLGLDAMEGGISL